MEKIYELVSRNEDKMLVAECLKKEELVKRDLIVGVETREPCKEELKGEPKLKGFLGPMYGGERKGQVVVRYETSEAYRQLSM